MKKLKNKEWQISYSKWKGERERIRRIRRHNIKVFGGDQLPNTFKISTVWKKVGIFARIKEIIINLIKKIYDSFHTIWV